MKKDRGFTLVELLVVIAIIGMLVALLLPAVQQARESARIMQCNNNLKNMGLAANNYQSTLKFFPSGGWTLEWVGDADRDGAGQPGSWCYALLPYLEQDALYQLPSDGQPDTITEQQKKGGFELSQTPLAVFHCPSRRTAQLYRGMTNRTRYNATSIPQMMAKGDYASNAGTGSVYRETSPKSIAEAMTYVNSGTWQPRGNGVVYAASNVGIRKIEDGLSNTYLFGEKYLRPECYQSSSDATVDAADDFGVYCGMDNDTARSCALNYVPLRDRQSYDDSSSRFGACHAGGFAMVMCDGSVHRINYKLDKQLHFNFGCRNDGGEVGSLE